MYLSIKFHGFDDDDATSVYSDEVDETSDKEEKRAAANAEYKIRRGVKRAPMNSIDLKSNQKKKKRKVISILCYL